MSCLLILNQMLGKWQVVMVIFAHLKRKSWLLIVNSDKYFTHNQLFTVIRKHKFCTKAFIIFSLLTEKTPQKYA